MSPAFLGIGQGALFRVALEVSCKVLHWASWSKVHYPNRYGRIGLLPPISTKQARYIGVQTLHDCWQRHYHPFAKYHTRSTIPTIIITA